MSIVRQWAVELVDIDTVAPHPRNFREWDLGALSVSIARLGLYLPVVVQRSTGYIVAGSGRWTALKQSGASEIPVRFVDATDEEALAILVGDNWIAQRGRNLDPELLDLMQELRDEAELFSAAGLEDDDVEALEREVAELDKPLKLDSRTMVKPKMLKRTCPECGAAIMVEGGTK